MELLLADPLVPLSLGPSARPTVIPLLLAVTPLPVGSTVPFQQPAALSTPLMDSFGQQAQVRTFDPVARAAQLAPQLPRQWSGTYQSFSGGAPLPVQISLASVTALGQMLDVRGEMTVASVTVPVQGNFNANTDQLDLLLLGDVPAGQLENGGEFLGLQLQGFNLAGWMAPRLTNPGGQLALSPVGGSGAAPVIRGLW